MYSIGKMISEIFYILFPTLKSGVSLTITVCLRSD